MTSVDMTTPIFSRNDMRAFLDGIGIVDLPIAEMPREWRMQIGPATVAELRFRGPVSVDEWDALLAHIAFYKTWFKDTPELKIRTIEEIAQVIADKMLGAKALETVAETVAGSEG